MRQNDLGRGSRFALSLTVIRAKKPTNTAAGKHRTAH